MALLIIYVCLVTSGLFAKNKKIIGYMLLIMMFVLFGFSSEIADSQNYIYKYSNVTTIYNKTEFLFVKTISFCNKLGLSYRGFLILLSMIYLLVIYFCIRNYTENWPFVLSLYAFFPFVMDVVQIRNTCALVFVYIGVFYILRIEDVKLKNIIIFSAILLVASFFHSMSIVVLVIMLSVIFVPKSIIKNLTIAVSILIIVLPNVWIVLSSKIAVLFQVNSRLNNYLDDIALHFESSNIRKCITVIFILSAYRFIIGLEKKYLSQDDKQNAETMLLIEKLEKLNIILYIVVPLTLIIPDSYRVVTEFSIVFYTVIAMSIHQNDLMIRQREESSITLLLIGCTLVNLYLLVLGSVNINTVWYPIFYNNEFF